MVNLKISVLAISAYWINIKQGTGLALGALFLLLLPRVLVAQQEPPELKGKKLAQYNETFFKAEKNRNLGNTEEAIEQYEQLLKLSDKVAVVHYNLGKVQLESKNYPQADYHLRRATVLDSSNLWYWNSLAQFYEDQNRPKPLLKARKKLVQLNPDNPDRHLDLARVYFAQGQSAEAMEQLDALTKLTGVNPRITELKKNILLQMGKVKKAAAEMRSLIEVYPNELDYYGTLAQIYKANGRAKEALQVYLEMLEVDSLDPRPHLDLANYYQEQKQVQKALYHLGIAMGSPRLEVDKKIQVLVNLFQFSQGDSLLTAQSFQFLDTMQQVHPQSAKVWAVTGDFYSREGKDIAAMAAFKKTLALQGGQEYKVWEQLLLLEIQNDRYDSLILDGPEAISYFPNQPLPYFFTGAAYLMLNNPQEAVNYLEQGVNYVFGNPRLKEQFYSQLASAHHQMEQHRQSDQYFEKALALNPRNAGTLNNYAYYLSVRGEKLDKALEMTQKSNMLSPDNPVYIDTYAWVLYQRKEYPKALAQMKEALRLSQNPDAELLEHYGDILKALQRIEEARAVYQKALKKDPKNNALSRKLQQLP